jgi:hypothetical protein
LQTTACATGNRCRRRWEQADQHVGQDRHAADEVELLEHDADLAAAASVRYGSPGSLTVGPRLRDGSATIHDDGRQGRARLRPCASSESKAVEAAVAMRRSGDRILSR